MELSPACEHAASDSPSPASSDLGTMELSPGREHTASGSSKRGRSGNKRRSLEYPCVSRFRHRRLLAYLRGHRYHDTFKSLVLETDVFFSVAHLQGLARLGKWIEGIKYIARFAPTIEDVGDAGQVFANFVHMHNVLDGIVAGKSHGAFVAGRYERYLKENPGVPPGNRKLVQILSTLLHNEKLRTSINWDLVRHKAADMIEELIAQVPEFSDLLRMPHCRTRPHNVLPIGFCSRMRRRRKVERVSAFDCAKFYLEKKRRLPSSTHCWQEKPCLGLSFEATARLADALAESVEAGMCGLLRGQH